MRLSKHVEVVNERFGTDFTESDQLFFDQVVEAASMDVRLKEAAAANPEEKFALVLGGQVENLMVERMEQNEEIVARYMSDPAFQAVVNKWVSAEVYERLRRLQVSDDGSAPYSAD